MPISEKQQQFLNELKTLCDKHGVVINCDERDYAGHIIPIFVGIGDWPWLGMEMSEVAALIGHR